MTVVAAIVTGVLIVILLATARFVPPDPGYLRATFTPEHVEHLSMFDSRGQQLGHRFLVILIGSLGLALWLFRPRALPLPSSPALLRGTEIVANYGGVFIIALLVGFLVLRLGNPPPTTTFAFQGRYALTVLLSPRAHWICLVIGLAATYAFAALAQGKVGRYPSWRQLLVGGLGLYVLVLTYLGIVQRVDFSGFAPELLAGIEWHYSGAVGPADRIAAGQRLGEIPIHSGLLPSVLLGAWQQTFGMLDFSSHIRVIAALQVVVLVASLVGYGAWYSWRAAPWILASLLVLPWMQPLHVAVLYPNQSAWRFFAFCLGVVLLAALHAQPVRKLAVALGIIGGVALLWNPETGVCLFLGYTIFLVLRTSRIPSAPAFWGLGHLLVGLLIAIGSFLLLIGAVLGYWVDMPALLKSYRLVGDYARGYGGLPLRQIDPLAILIFVHALFVVSRGLLRWGGGAVMHPREHCRIALAALLILWSGYYLNRPDPWNLWSFLFLYGFLVGSFLEGERRTGLRLLGSPGLAALAVIIIPAVLAANTGALRSLKLALRQAACPKENIVSGICMPSAIARALEQKAATLREYQRRGPILYFTSDSYLMPLMTGIVQSLPERDAYSDTILKRDFEHLAQRIFTIRPACALFDDPGSLLNGSQYHRSFYSRLRTAIAPLYERAQPQGGWEAWCLKSS